MNPGPKYSNHDGFLMPIGFPSEHFEESLTYKAKDTDIFVTTYPKCGTTWTQNIVYLILNDGIPLPRDQKLTKIFPHLEEVGCAALETLPDPRLIKTHLPYDMTPMNSKAKYIYVARNPKDCVVSFYHHTVGFIKAYDYEHGTFNEYFDLFLDGKVDFGDYFDNLESWLKHRQDPNVLFLTYEGLKEDIRQGILSIASFLGQDYVSRLLESEECILKRVIENCSLKSMKKDAERWSSKRPEGHTEFIRKGIVGDWMSHFTPDQSERMNKKIVARLSQDQLDDLWPQLDLLN